MSNVIAVGTPRPMEIHAHTPRRYVGDMAAWIHQAVASEMELVDILVGSLQKGSYHLHLLLS